MTRARQPHATSRSNPLVGFRRQSGMSIRDQAAHHGPLLIPKAQENFQAKMEQSDRILTEKGMLPIPIFLSVGKWDDDPDEASRMGALVIHAAHKQPRVSQAKPGDPGRDTPVTPFNMFHQLEHDLAQDRSKPVTGFEGNIDRLAFASLSISRQIKSVNDQLFHDLDLGRIGNREIRGEREKIAYSYGICSRNAEMGVFGFNNWPDALGDVFAAYCMSMNAVCSDRAWRFLEEKVNAAFPNARESSNILHLKGHQLQLYEMDAAFKAFTLGVFIRAYYSNSMPYDVDLYLSDFSMTELGEREGWDLEETQDFRQNLRAQAYDRVIQNLRAISRFPKVVLYSVQGT